MSGLASFSSPARDWFLQSFGEPTPVQKAGWPAIASGGHALLLAPTGSGKTLAAFFWAIDQLSRLPKDAPPAVRVVYISPLKALVADIERNLRAPLIGLERAQERAHMQPRKVTVSMRTGDTSQSERRGHLKAPPDILITTPESLYLMLGSKAKETLKSTTTVIVDEIHALAPSKRGAHLALSLERLAALCDEPFQRIGLTATVRPHREAARFLAGAEPVTIVDHSAKANVALSIEVPCEDMTRPPSLEAQSQANEGGSILGQLYELDRNERRRGRNPAEAAETAEAAKAAAGREQADAPAQKSPGDSPTLGRELSGMWAVIYPRLVALIGEHTSVVIFVNSRSLCERMAGAINQLAGEEWVRAHHGSVSRHNRQEIEEALKAGTLRGIVATSSLELGIDMGSIDLVILIESPGSVARGLQRVGRAGHGVGQQSKGVLLPKHPGDLLEACVVADRMRQGELEPIVVPQNALDVLAQQLVAHCASEPIATSELFQLVRRAYPYEQLSLAALHSVLDMLSGTYPSDEFATLRPLLTWDRAKDVVTGRRGTPSIASRNAGTIVDRGNFGVFLAGDGPRVGELDEEMVHESRRGDIFTLGASAWRIEEITRDQVKVTPAPGQAGKMPFWRGEGPGRPVALGQALGAFCRTLTSLPEAEAKAELSGRYGCDENASNNIWRHLSAQHEAMGEVPNDRHISIERFRDEIGDTRICLLSPFGARVHAPWAMLLEASLPQVLGHAVEVLHNDDGIALRLGALEAADSSAPTKELAVTDFLPAHDNLEDALMQQLGQTAVFASHFRENATRSLLLLRQNTQGRTPLWQQRLRAKTLLAAAERYASFPIVLETYRQLLRDVFDLPALREILVAIEQRTVRVTLSTRPKPSPFARSLAYAYVQTYLYEQDAPVAERRVQALALDYELLRDLLGEQDVRSLLDADIIDEVESSLQCVVAPYGARDADGVFDLLHRLGDLSVVEVAARLAMGHTEESETEAETEGGEPSNERAERGSAEAADGASSLEGTALDLLERLVAERRAAMLRIQGELRYVAIDDVARYRDGLGIVPPSGLPARFLGGVRRPIESLLSRYARTHGPFFADAVAARFGLGVRQATDILDLLAKEQGFAAGAIDPRQAGRAYCHPDVLRRIKRATMQRLRRQVAAVEPRDYARFLPSWQGLDEPQRGAEALEMAVRQLAGLALPFGALMREILPARIKHFVPDQLTELCAAGSIVWVGAGALGPRDGRIRLYPREAIGALLDPPARPLVDRTAVHDGLLQALTERGPSFVVTLQQRLGGRTSLAVVGDALWDLVWAGLVTNDTLQPLMHLVLAQGRRGRAGPAPSAALGGRWSLVSDAMAEPPSPTERLHQRISVLLARYGIVSRNAVAAEQIPNGFTPIYTALKAMEEASAVRRGLFVDGLAAAQFALPLAVERLRAGQAAQAGRLANVRCLAALDPSQCYGSILPWPKLVADAGKRKLRRVAEAKVLLVDGEPHAYLEANGEHLWLFAAALANSEEDWRPLLAGLCGLARRAQTRHLLLVRIDGESALRSPHTKRLLALGLRTHIDGLLVPDDLEPARA